MAKRLSSPDPFSGYTQSMSDSDRINKRVRSHFSHISVPNIASEASSSNTAANVGLSGESSAPAISRSLPLFNGVSANEASGDTGFDINDILSGVQEAGGVGNRTQQLQLALTHEMQANKMHARLLSKSLNKIKLLQDAIGQSNGNQPHHIHRQVHHSVQQAVQQPVHQLVRQLMQQSVKELVQQSVQQLVQQPALHLVQQPVVQPAQQSVQQSVNELMQQAVQQLVHQSVQQHVQQPVVQIKQQPTFQSVRYPACQPAQQSVQHPLQQPVVQIMRQPTLQSVKQLIRQPAHQTVQQPVQQTLPTASSSTSNSGSHPLGTGSMIECELLRSPLKYGLNESGTLISKALGYAPRRALVHQFGNMDHQTVVAYGNDRLQLWNPIDNKIVSEWSGVPEDVYIEQAEPVSLSKLAVVSSFKVVNQKICCAGKLFFVNSRWNAQDGRFANMSCRSWVGNAQLGMGISIVEGVNPDVSSDNGQVSLFTGALSGGAIYRRIFDISVRDVKTIHKQKMERDHRGVVSALCHVEARNCVISGSTFGDIHLNDHGNGRCMQTIKLGEDSTVGSITRCPFNPDLFMAGYCHPKNELLVFDRRLGSEMGVPVLTLKDAGSQITSRYSRPAWDVETGLICAPMRRYAGDQDTTTINIWDPRFIKCGDADSHMIYHQSCEALSVDFTKSVNGRDRTMVTASEDSVRFMPFTAERL